MHDSSVDRRTLLRAVGAISAGVVAGVVAPPALRSAAAAVAPTLAAAGSPTAVAARPDVGVSVFPFPLSAVSLRPGRSATT